MNKELYLKAAFCCMACDGDIASEEIQLIKDYVMQSALFEGIDVENKLNDYVASINSIGVSFLNSFLNELKIEKLTEEQSIEIMRISIEMIEIDKEIKYSEIKFFKKIHACLDVSDEVIEKEFPNKEDYFLPDNIQQDFEFAMDSAFTEIKIGSGLELN